MEEFNSTENEIKEFPKNVEGDEVRKTFRSFFRYLVSLVQ